MMPGPACPWTLEDCAIWKGITRRFLARMRQRTSFMRTAELAINMRDLHHQGDRWDYELMIVCRHSRIPQEWDPNHLYARGPMCFQGIECGGQLPAPAYQWGRM